MESHVLARECRGFSVSSVHHRRCPRRRGELTHPLDRVDLGGVVAGYEDQLRFADEDTIAIGQRGLTGDAFAVDIDAVGGVLSRGALDPAIDGRFKTGQRFGALCTSSL